MSIPTLAKVVRHSLPDWVYCCLTWTSQRHVSPAKQNPIRILGIDPGLRITGFGVIEKTGNKLTYIASGCIKTDAKASLPTRLGTIHSGLCELLAQYRPDQSVVEIVFVNVNPQSTLLLGQARGAAISALVASGIEVAEYTALQVKQAVVGNGHAKFRPVKTGVLGESVIEVIEGVKEGDEIVSGSYKTLRTLANDARIKIEAPPKGKS